METINTTKDTEQQPTTPTPEASGDQGGERLFTQDDVNRIISERLARLKNDLSQRDETIKRLEEASGDIAATREELRRYKEEEAARKKAEEEAETDRILTEAAEQALDGKEFVNDFTRAHFLSELKKAIADPANKGKRAAKLFEEMTKDMDGIFRNPQLEPLKLPGVDKHAGPPMSKEDIFKITDAAERQKAIAANINLFRKDE